MDPVLAAADLDQLVLRLDVERPEGPNVPQALVGTDRFRNDPDRGVSATRPWRVGSATRVGKLNITDDPAKVEALARRPGPPGRDDDRRAVSRPRLWTTPRCPAGSQRPPVTGDPSTTFRVEPRRTTRLAGSRSRTIAHAASCGLLAQEGDDIKAGELREFAGETPLLPRLDEHGDQLGRGHELPAVEDPARGGVAVRLRLGTGREVVLTLTASAPAVSRAPRCKCSDCEPSVFEMTRVQVKTPRPACGSASPPLRGRAASSSR